MPEKGKDFWDKLSSITPLIIGIMVTGVGAAFTQIYNFQQLQLNRILALEKLRPLLISDKPEDREFGYASFVALGYEETAIRIIKIKKDYSGREVLVQLEESKSESVKENAKDALNALDEAQKIINRFEYGSEEGLISWTKRGAGFATEMGIKTKLGIALIADTVVHSGLSRTKKFAAATTERLGGYPAKGISEPEWIREFLRVRVDWLSGKSLPKGMLKRTGEFNRLIDLGDWDLSEYETQP